MFLKLSKVVEKFHFDRFFLKEICKKGWVLSKRSAFQRLWVEEESISSLIEGKHFVSCPNCGKKMASVTKRHYKVCKKSSTPYTDIYSEFLLESIKKSDEQKQKQSLTLKERFKTKAGELTRQQISEASRRFNSDPEFLEKKRFTSLEVQNRPGNKELRSVASKEMWSDPNFRARMKVYVDSNIASLRESAKNARRFLKKQSKLHIGYKETMLREGITGFISEYSYGPYSIDEADPLAKIAVEVDGCYWHGCETCDFPGDTRIMAIDRRKETYLKNRGWLILRIKEHEIKKNGKCYIEEIKKLQVERRGKAKEAIREAFKSNQLMVRSMVEGKSEPVWVPISDVVRHTTPHKKMIKVTTEIGSAIVTEDHSLFQWTDRTPIETSELKEGDRIVGLPRKEFEPVIVNSLQETESQEHTYDLSVPGTENFVMSSGILAHNTYSISGVSLDIDKSSKYQQLKDEFIGEYDKTVEAAKQSIKIVRGLRQFRYGVGITAALGPLNRVGVQSRRNLIEAGSVGVWS